MLHDQRLKTQNELRLVSAEEPREKQSEQRFQDHRLLVFREPSIGDAAKGTQSEANAGRHVSRNQKDMAARRIVMDS